MLMLIISTIKEIPDEKAGALPRVIFLLPGAFCAIILAGNSEVVTSSDTTNTIVSLNTTEAWTESISSSISLIDPVWAAVHYLIFIVIVFYVITQIMNILTKKY